MSDLFCIKMHTGETIFTELLRSKEDENIVFFSNPFVLKIVSMNSITASPWMPYTEIQSFPVSINSILTLGELNEEFSQYYLTLVEGYNKSEPQEEQPKEGASLETGPDLSKLKLH